MSGIIRKDMKGILKSRLNKGCENRFWEIDFLRGIAIIMMIVYHTAYDLIYFAGYGFILGGFWTFLQKATGGLFIVLVGISLTLSYNKAVKKQKDENILFRKYLKRGLTVFSWGLVITVLTLIFLKEGTVYFGILHFIGLSIILAYPFIKKRSFNLIAGIIILILGTVVRKVFINSYMLLWLGIMPTKFYTVDYFPIIPWFGIVLIGIFIGNTFYKGYKRGLKIPDLSKNNAIKPLCFMGKYALVIYLVHQPILLAVLYIFSII